MEGEGAGAGSMETTVQLGVTSNLLFLLAVLSRHLYDHPAIDTSNQAFGVLYNKPKPFCLASSLRCFHPPTGFLGFPSASYSTNLLLCVGEEQSVAYCSYTSSYLLYISILEISGCSLIYRLPTEFTTFLLAPGAGRLETTRFVWPACRGT